MCVPDCFSGQSSQGVLVVTLIALIIGVIASIAFLIIAFIRCKEVYGITSYLTIIINAISNGDGIMASKSNHQNMENSKFKSISN